MISNKCYNYIRRTTISKTCGKATKSPCDPHRSLDRHRSQFCISTHLTISPCGSWEPQTYQLWNRIPSSPDARKFQLSIPVSIWWIWAERWLGFRGLGAKLVKCERQWRDKSWSTWFTGNLLLVLLFRRCSVTSCEMGLGPFLESHGNLTGPESYFEIKVSRKVGCVLTSNEVHFVSLADNFTVQISKLLKIVSLMENKPA